VIIVDFSQPSSLTNVRKWIEEIYEKADVQEPVIMILASKKDLETSKKFISSKQIEEFQHEMGSEILFFEVSARIGTNINESFEHLSERLLLKGQQRKITGFKLKG
jgi:GTPase SAR1 family protein